MAEFTTDIRRQIDRLHQMVEADPVLARAFERDPKGTLEANGIDTSGLTFAGDEVTGYMRSEMPDNCFCLWHNEWGECTVSFCL